MGDFVTIYPARAGSCQDGGRSASKGGNAPDRKMRCDVVFNPNTRSIPTPVLQPSAPPSIALSDLPDAAAEAVTRVLALFDKHVGSGDGPDDFGAAERDALIVMKEVCSLLLRSVIESRDDGAAGIERDGQVRYRVEETKRR